MFTVGRVLSFFVITVLVAPLSVYLDAVFNYGDPPGVDGGGQIWTCLCSAIESGALYCLALTLGVATWWEASHNLSTRIAGCRIVSGLVKGVIFLVGFSFLLFYLWLKATDYTAGDFHCYMQSSLAAASILAATLTKLTVQIQTANGIHPT